LDIKALGKLILDPHILNSLTYAITAFLPRGAGALFLVVDTLQLTQPTPRKFLLRIDTDHATIVVRKRTD
jgi:hypothetical protein